MQTTMASEKRDPRVFLAAERTFLAWLRTGLAMMGFGFVVARFGVFMREIAAERGGPAPAPTGISVEVGTALVMAGVGVAIASMVRYLRLVRQLERDVELKGPSWLAVGLALGLAAIGALLAIRLVATS